MSQTTLSLFVAFMLLALTTSTHATNSFLKSMQRSTAGKGVVRFMTIGDWGCANTGSTHPNERLVIDSMAIEAKPDFIIALGDNFYENGVTGVNDPMFKSAFENAFVGENFKVPFYVILGNHDYRGNTAAQLRYSEKSDRWKAPALYYDQVFPINGKTKLHIIFLDTTAILKGDNTQIAWLGNRLHTSEAEWIFIVGHHSIFSVGEHGNHEALITDVLTLMDKYKVDLYIGAHEHTLQRLQCGDNHILVSGGGCKIGSITDSQVTDCPYSSSRIHYAKATLGYTVHEVTDSLHSFRIVPVGGGTGHSQSLPRRT